jgi:hypothetical protein
MIGIIGFTSDLFLAWVGTVLFPWKRKNRARSKSAGTVTKPTPATEPWPEAVEPVLTEALAADKAEVKAHAVN